MSPVRVVYCLGMMIAGIFLLALAVPTLAQNGIPIQNGQNAFGELTTEISSVMYTLSPNSGETATIQVLALSPGFIPRFRVLNAAGVEIVNAANPNGLATITGSVSFDGGVFTIEVMGGNGSVGQFVLSLQPGTPLPPPVTLTLNQPVSGMVGGQTPVQVYRFDTASIGAVAVTVVSPEQDAGVLLTLFDETLGKTIASSDAGVVGVAFKVPAVGHVYRVEIRANAAGDTSYSICLGTCGSNLLAAGNAGAQPTATPTIEIAAPAFTSTVAASCTVTSNAGGSVNVRSGNGTQYIIVGTLPLGQAYPVLGQNTSNGIWYQINLNGALGWVSAAVTRTDGNCSALPFVAAPVNAQLAPTTAPVGAPPATTPEVEPNGSQPDVLSDLTPINIQVSNPGDGTLNVDIVVYNAGSAPVTAPYAVKTCLDSTICNEITGFSEGLQPGETMSFTDSVPYPGGGVHTVTVTVDSQNEVSESNEGNNIGFASFNL